MKKIFTICFLIIASQLFSQNNTIDSLQRRVSQVWGSEKIFVLNKENNNTIKELQVKYETYKKNQQIKLDQTIIKNKELIIYYSLAGASVVFIALLIIIILYRKRNQAYRHLVYLNLNPFDKKLNDPGEEKENNMQGYHNTIDSVLKQQITTCLDKQMASKVYTEVTLTINRLAEKCETNRSYLSQLIHEKYQMNFNTFINKYRIEEAKRIFLEPDNDIPLKALYEQLGFSSYIRFHEAFKKYTGVTPSFFLKTIKTL